MSRARPYLSWCPRREVCTRTHCAHCGETRTEWFKRRIADNAQMVAAREANRRKATERAALQAKIRRDDALAADVVATINGVTGLYRTDFKSDAEYIAAKNHLYRQRSAENAFQRSLLSNEKEWLEAQSPTLYADNIGPKTNAADKADPVPAWILRHRNAYSSGSNYKSCMANVGEW